MSNWPWSSWKPISLKRCTVSNTAWSQVYCGELMFRSELWNSAIASLDCVWTMLNILCKEWHDGFCVNCESTLHPSCGLLSHTEVSIKVEITEIYDMTSTISRYLNFLPTNTIYISWILSVASVTGTPFGRPGLTWSRVSILIMKLAVYTRFTFSVAC